MSEVRAAVPSTAGARTDSCACNGGTSIGCWDYPGLTAIADERLDSTGARIARLDLTILAPEGVDLSLVDADDRPVCDLQAADAAPVGAFRVWSCNETDPATPRQLHFTVDGSEYVTDFPLHEPSFGTAEPELAIGDTIPPTEAGADWIIGGQTWDMSDPAHRPQIMPVGRDGSSSASSTTSTATTSGPVELGSTVIYDTDADADGNRIGELEEGLPVLDSDLG
ncbi:MAG: hypothetical protein QM733_04305 [Ilumatobacteraceae bacterium]